jgi:hypothetical protein
MDANGLPSSFEIGFTLVHGFTRIAICVIRKETPN